MARPIRSIVLTSLVLAMLACALPAQTAVPSPTPTALPRKPVPTSITQVVAGGVEAGSWTEAEGTPGM